MRCVPRDIQQTGKGWRGESCVKEGVGAYNGRDMKVTRVAVVERAAKEDGSSLGPESPSVH